MIDPASGDTYYVNNETGESQWEMPEDAWVEHDHDGRKYLYNTITGKFFKSSHITCISFATNVLE